MFTVPLIEDDADRSSDPTTGQGAPQRPSKSDRENIRADATWKLQDRRLWRTLLVLSALVALTRPMPAPFAAFAFAAVVGIEITMVRVLGRLNPRRVPYGFLLVVFGVAWSVALNTGVFLLISFWGR